MRWLAGMCIILARIGGASALAAPVQVVVISVSGNSIFIDHGRASGIVPNLRVRFAPAGAAGVEGIVVDVSANSARIEMYQSASPPPVGTTGVIEVPDSPLPAATTGATSTSAPTIIPAHPPWTRQEDERTPGMPLLAPAFSRSPAERAPTFHGRVFSEFDASTDRGSGRDGQFYLGRAGTTFVITNPIHQGGELRFDAEFNRRGEDLTDSSTSNDDYILNRFSYAIGTEEYSPYRLELGRFTSYYLPEIGLVDGVEAALRLQNGLNLGGGIGAYPLAYTDREEGDDVGFHLFLDYNSAGAKPLSATLGYQKTWHNGAADRDVFFARASAWLTDKIWLYGSAQADIYTANDTQKSSSLELSQAWLQARYTPDSSKGISVSASRYVWIDVQRNEFQPLPPPELISNGRVDRLEVSVWRDILPNLRPTLRGNYFNDQRGDGFGGEADLDWTSIRGSPIDLHGAVFYNEGSFTKDYGFREELRLTRNELQLFIGHEYLRYTSTGSIFSTDYLTRQNIRAGVSKQFGSWYLSITADHYFGDADDSYSLNTLAEYRF